jgi:hypothetical protein
VKTKRVETKPEKTKGKFSVLYSCGKSRTHIETMPATSNKNSENFAFLVAHQNTGEENIREITWKQAIFE